MHTHPLRVSLLAAAVAGALALSGLVQAGDPPTARAGAQANQAQAYGESMKAARADTDLNRKDKKFIDKALSSNAAEVELGRLAEQRAGSDDVREFARTMQQHHRQASEEVAALSSEHRADDAEPERKQRKKIDQLAELEDGQAFDAAYAALMVELHQQDIELFEEVADNDAYSQPVRELAQQKLGGLRQHLQQAQQLDRQVGRVAGVDED
jgi:putative membrane protein